MSDDTRAAISNRDVAEAAGWKFADVEPTPGLEPRFYVFDPAGNEVFWEHAYGKQNDIPAWKLDDLLPDFLHDANAALSLIEGMGLHSWSMHALQKPRLAISWTDKGVCVDLHPYAEATAETLPLAICKAWLANAARVRE